MREVIPAIAKASKMGTKQRHIQRLENPELERASHNETHGHAKSDDDEQACEVDGPLLI